MHIGGEKLMTELAQLEERSAFNRVVVGSSPIFGEYINVRSASEHSVVEDSSGFMVES